MICEGLVFTALVLLVYHGVDNVFAESTRVVSGGLKEQVVFVDDPVLLIEAHFPDTVVLQVIELHHRLHMICGLSFARVSWIAANSDSLP